MSVIIFVIQQPTSLSFGRFTFYNMVIS